MNIDEIRINKEDDLSRGITRIALNQSDNELPESDLLFLKALINQISIESININPGTIAHNIANEGLNVSEAITLISKYFASKALKTYKKDCLYYCNSIELKCAVHPILPSCKNCSDYRVT